MKKIYRHRYVLALFFTIGMHATEALDADLLAPEELSDKIDSLYLFMQEGLFDVVCDKFFGHEVWDCPKLKGYLIKRSVDRITGRQKLARCIRDLKLHHLTVPKKYLYHIPSTGTELTNDNYLVVVEKLDILTGPLCITLEEVQQLCSLVLTTGYLDLKANNIARTTENKIAIIDTEDRMIDLNWGGPCPTLEALFLLNGFNLSEDFTPEALKYIFTELKACAPLHNETYQAILKRLKAQQGSWDFVSYFQELYPEYNN